MYIVVVSDSVGLSQPWFVHARALLHTPVYWHTLIHTMYTLNHIINQPLNFILLPICNPPPLPLLCPKTHCQGNRQYSAPPRHPGKVREHKHIHTQSHTHRISISSSASVCSTHRQREVSLITHK